MTDKTTSNWSDYYESQQGRQPRELFCDAVSRMQTERKDSVGGFVAATAIDLGCGDGTETLALLHDGWQVRSFDREPVAIARLEQQVNPDLRGALQTTVCGFEALTLPTADLIYAGLSLPFCNAAHFDELWASIRGALRVGGRFAGHFFGPKDSWSKNPKMSFHSHEDLTDLLAGLSVERFDEIDEDGNSFNGPKHWHIFQVIARRLE